jgi:hypothetical protein
MVEEGKYLSQERKATSRARSPYREMRKTGVHAVQEVPVLLSKEGEKPLETRGYYVFNLVVNVLVALGLGAIIVLILTVLNHSGWFALISGLIGAILYCAGVFLHG